MKRFFKWLAIIIGVPIAALAGVVVFAAIADYRDRQERWRNHPDYDVGETIVDRTETSPHDRDFKVVIARVLSRTKGTPIRWYYYDQSGASSYDLKKPSVDARTAMQPRFGWIKTRHSEICTDDDADIWQHHWTATGSSAGNVGGAIGSLFYFKNPDGSIRWTVSVIKKC